MAQPQPTLSEASGSTSRSATASPHMHPDSPLSDGTDEPTDLERTEDASLPTVRRRRSNARAGPSDGSGPETREKRKRSRVTPDQLTQLESLFAANRSPTAARRKEISDMLGMTERQTQIWFQNRRAKAKLQASNKGRPSTAPSPELPPILNLTDDPQLRARIHEDGPIRLLSCTDVAIGTWRRIATLQAKYDLMAYVCEARRCVAWYVHCAGAGFKMEIPFEIITDATIDGVSPGMAVVSLTLSQPPSFFHDGPASFGTESPVAATRSWKQCSDWTEDMQASKVLRHELIGSAAQLSQDLVERYQLCRLDQQGYTAPSRRYGGDATYGAVPGIHAPVPVAGRSGLYAPQRIDYLSRQHMLPGMLPRRASEANISTHSSAPWDSPPVQHSSSQHYTQLQQGVPVWAEDYSMTVASKPIVPYSIQPVGPMRRASHLPPSPSSGGTPPSFVGHFYSDFQGPPRRDSDQSFLTSSSEPPSSVSSFDLPSPSIADPSGSIAHWSDPALVEHQPLYDPHGYDQMQQGHAHMGTHVGTDVPSYGFDPPGSMPGKHYG